VKSAESNLISARRSLWALGIFTAVAAALGIASLKLQPGPPESDVPRTSLDPRHTLTALDASPEAQRTFAVEIDGLFTDPGGQPLAGVHVAADGVDVVTLADGRFRLPRTRRAVSASLTGYFPTQSVPTECVPAERAGLAVRLDGSRPEPPGSGDAPLSDLNEPWARERDVPMHFVLYPAAQARGQVLDPCGRGVAGAAVEVSKDLSGPTQLVRTAEDGRFSISPLSSGTYHVLFRHPQFQGCERTLALAAGGADEDCNVVLEPGAPLKIQVRSSDGVPLADAQAWLEVERGSREPEASSSRYLGRTDDLGRLNAAWQRDGTALVRIRLAGFREAVEAAAPSGDVRFVLEAAPSLQAQAIDARTGLPVRVSTVRLELESQGRYEEAPHRGVLFHSLADGRVRVGLPPLPGTYRLAVRSGAHGYGFSEPVPFNGLDSPAPVLVRLEARTRFFGRVLARGQPVANASVELLGADGSVRPLGESAPGGSFPRTSLARSRSDADGRFDLELARWTPCRLHVDHEDHAEFLSPVLLEPPPAPDGEFPASLARPAKLRGRVSDGRGAGVPRTAVVMTSSRVPPRLTWTDADGAFEFRRLPPSSDYSVRALAGSAETPPGPAEALARAARIEVREGGESWCEVVLDGPALGTAAGRILVDGAGRACTLRLARLDAPARDGLSRWERRVNSDATGLFLAAALEPGRYRLDGGEVPFSQALEVRAHQTTRVDVEIRTLSLDIEAYSLLEGATVEGPLKVELRRLDGDSEHRGHEHSGGDGPNMGRSAPTAPDGALPLSFEGLQGNARVRGLFPGIYRLRVVAPGFNAAESTIEVQHSRGERVGLVPEQQLRLQLYEDDGSPLLGPVEVEILQDGGVLHRDAADAAGEVVLPALAAGEYEVVVRRSGSELRRRLLVGPEAPAKTPRR
jgi:hypothetical protein